MNEITTLSRNDNGAFEQCLGQLISELKTAIKHDFPSLLMAVHSSEFICADAKAAIENFLIDEGQNVSHLRLQELCDDGLGYLIDQLKVSSKSVFFVDGFNHDVSNKELVYSILNHHRYLFLENSSRVILWLTETELAELAHSAPEFWVNRHCMVALPDSLQPERVLQNALESAWQGIGEYSDTFEDTEEKISLRESILDGLPDNIEATAARANLLLTLGILNWRKGNFEKASELAHDALKLAAKMQDTWFEAECFNAVALVRASLGKTDEAIDAYKQAIKLAPSQIFAWNNLGNLCLKIGRNDEAMIAFRKAVDHNPADSIAWNGLGDVYHHLGYADDAVAAYRKAIEHSPSLHHPWHGLGEVYARMGRVDEAVASYQKAINLNKHFVPSWLRVGDLAAAQGRQREAVKAYQQALAINSKDPVVWNGLGTVYLKAEKFDDAIEAFVKTIELDRNFGWAHSNLAYAFSQQGKFEECIALYQRSIELFQDDKEKAESWNRLAIVYRRMNDYENAVAAYQTADSLDSRSLKPTQPPASDEGEVDSAQEVNPILPVESESIDEGGNSSRPAEPIQKIEIDHSLEAPAWIFQKSNASTLSANQATKEQPLAVETPGGDTMSFAIPFLSFGSQKTQDTETKRVVERVSRSTTKAETAQMWNEKGNTEFRKGAFEDAVQSYRKAIELDKSFGRPYCNLGVANLMLGKYAEAIVLLQKSIEMLASNQEQAVAWNELGNLYRSLNDYDNAVAAYQKADELDPNHAGVRDMVEYQHSEPNSDNAQVWNELGDLFFNTGSYPVALKCYEKAIDVDPDDGQSYSKMATSLLHQGKYEKAIPLYQKSIELSADKHAKAESWNRLGVVYRKMNDYEQAVEAYMNAVKLDDESEKILSRARFSLLGNCRVD